MSIAFVNVATATSTSSTDLTPSEYPSASTNDFVLLYATHSATNGSYTVDSSWIPIEVDFLTAASADLGLWYQTRSSTSPDYQVTYSGNSNNMRVSCMGFSGVSITSPLDVVYNTSLHSNSTLNDLGLSAAPAITTLSTNSMVVLVQHLEDSVNTGTAGAPSGYTLNVDYQQNDRVHHIASKLVTSAGTETPGVWTHTYPQTSTDSTNFTIALKSFTGLVTMDLLSKTGSAQSSLTNVSWAWFDQDVGSLNAPTDKGSTETTDVSGEIILELNNTTLTSGQTGTLILYDSTGSKIGVYRVPID